MENEIREAIRLLGQNGYVVTKLTEDMKKDSKACERMNFEGDCSSCSCSICIME